MNSTLMVPDDLKKPRSMSEDRWIPQRPIQRIRKSLPLPTLSSLVPPVPAASGTTSFPSSGQANSEPSQPLVSAITVSLT